MPVRLTQPYGGQAVNTLYWGTDETALRGVGIADDQIELASDYEPQTRIVTADTATISRSALKYKMNSSNPQILNLPILGFHPIGTVLTVEQLGSGSTTLTPAAGVTVNLGNGVTSLLTRGVGYIGQLVKESPGVWTAFGGFGG